jgi:glycosyltransferase involved in cell wall biosynthesis
LSAVHVLYAPDPDSARVAVRLAGKKRCRVIFDIHEMYHGALLSRWIRGPAAKIAGNLLQRQIRRTCSRCDLVMGVSHAVLEPFRQAHTENLVVRSCAPACFAQEPPADAGNPAKGAFTVMHGKADMYRGTDVVLEALHLARKRLPRLRSIMFDGTLRLSPGFGREAFRRRMAALQLEEVVDLRPAVSLREMPAILRTCDAGLIAYGRALGADSLPNRLFEYMAAGLPVIAPTYAKEICRILRDEECGVTADFEDPSSIAAVLVELAQNPEQCRRMGRRARQAFENRHNWEVEVQPLLRRIRGWVSG